jgi:hypothetical protein
MSIEIVGVIIAVVFGILSLVTVYPEGRTWLKKRFRKCRLGKKALSKQIEQTARVGLVTIYDKAQKTRDSTLGEATESYWLMGVSAQYVRGAEEFLNCLSRRQMCRYRFLLLAPDSPYMDMFASRERGYSSSVIAGEIRNSIETLKDFRDRYMLSVEIRLYDELPTFRILIVDEKRCYVSFYGDLVQGIDAPQMVFEKAAGNTSFYFPFRGLYEQAWKRATPLEKWEQARNEL